ncbi:hypothetical protein Tco_0758033 [Tanacetum coccineum]
MMTCTKFDIEKFDRKNDFRLWQVIGSYRSLPRRRLQRGFGKIRGDLAAIDTTLSDEDQALLLLTSLPSFYDNFMDTLLYGRDTLKLEDVLATINSMELQKMTEAKGDGGEGLYVRWRSGQLVEDFTREYVAVDVRLSKVFWAEDTTMSTYLVNKSPPSAIGFKTPVDMLGFFGWLASIKQGMLEPVKVKCIFLGYHKGIVGNKLWRLDDVTSKVVLCRNMSFNESGKYKKTFIGSRVGTGSMVLHGIEFEVEPQDNKEAAFAVAAVDKIYGHESLTFNNTVASMVVEDAVTTTIAITGSIHQAEITKGLLDKAIKNVLGIEIIRDQSGSTLRVSQSRFYDGKLVQNCWRDTPYCRWRIVYQGSVMQKRMISVHVYMRLEARVSNVDDTRMCMKLRSYDAAHDGFVTTEATYMTLTEAAKEVI